VLMTTVAFVGVALPWRNSQAHEAGSFGVRRFLAERGVSAELGRRITEFLAPNHCSVMRSHEKDFAGLQLLPQFLHDRLKVELYAPVITRSPFIDRYSVLNARGVRELCHAAVEASNLSPGDRLFLAGRPAEKMFFVHSGLLDYTHQENEPRLNGQVAAGHWVSEPALWMRWTHCGTPVARTSCEIFGLSSGLFRALVSRHERGLAFAMGYAQLFFEYTCDSCHPGGWRTDLGNTRDLFALVRRAASDHLTADVCLRVDEEHKATTIPSPWRAARPEGLRASACANPEPCISSASELHLKARHAPGNPVKVATAELGPLPTRFD